VPVGIVVIVTVLAYVGRAVVIVGRCAIIVVVGCDGDRRFRRRRKSEQRGIVRSRWRPLLGGRYRWR
jgi:hypothetical protein